MQLLTRDINYMSKFKEEIRHEYPLDENSIVFDIGGYRGEWAEIIYDRYGSKIYCFEPFFKIDNPNIKIYPYGLGGYGRGENFYIDNNKTGLICKTGKLSHVVIHPIMDIIELLYLEHIDLMKVNIEGMEYELLEKLIEEDWAKNITDIQVQFHHMKNSDERMLKIQNELKKTHKLTYQYRYVWENWRLK